MDLKNHKVIKRRCRVGLTDLSGGQLHSVLGQGQGHRIPPQVDGLQLALDARREDRQSFLEGWYVGTGS